MSQLRSAVLTTLFLGFVSFALVCPAARVRNHDPCAHATLRLRSTPVAEVYVDDAPRGTTPCEISLAPGRHVITLCAEGFLPHESTLVLAVGGSHTLEATLVAGTVDDTKPLAALATRHGMRVEPFQEPTPTRGGAQVEPVVLLWPKGRVRPEGLDSFAIEVDETFEGTPWVEFRVAGKLLRRYPFDPEKLLTVAPMGEELLAPFPREATVEWGLCREVGGELSPKAEFRVVAWPHVTAQLRRLEGDPAFDTQPPLVRELLEVQTLAAFGLESEALQRSVAICRAYPDAVEAYRALLTALQLTDAEGSCLWAMASKMVLDSRLAGPSLLD